MKKLLLLSICIATSYVYSETIFQDSFEYANTEGEVPLGWTSPEKQWICGQFENDHNRKPHHGNWYTYTEEEEAWLFMRADALPGIHYNLSFWTISDGPFQMEILYGNNPNPESMSGTIAPANEIDSENYLQFSVEYDLYENYDLYLGFHAISLGGTALCIDDVAIDQMHQYDFMVKVMTTDTLDLAYGESANFRFSVLNTGYDRETLVLSSPSEMFTDTHCFIDGEAVTRFDIEPNENIIIDDLEGAKIRFGACDYGMSFSPYSHPYQGKPFVEAFFSIHENDFYPLSFSENEALFDEAIGHVFEIDLSQLQGIANDKWVSVGFMVTDEAGNSQIQVLSPLFFAGSYTAVGEDVATNSMVYPNPFQTSFTVSAANPVSGKAVVNVCNVLGENIYTKVKQCNGTTEFVIDGSSLMSGIYFYSIATENGKLQGRIVKE